MTDTPSPGPKVTQLIAAGNVRRIRMHRDAMAADRDRTVTFDEALEDLLDKADAYMHLKQVPAFRPGSSPFGGTS
jgi:hypothetical protein